MNKKTILAAVAATMGLAASAAIGDIDFSALSGKTVANDLNSETLGAVTVAGEMTMVNGTVGAVTTTGELTLGEGVTAGAVTATAGSVTVVDDVTGVASLALSGASTTATVANSTKAAKLTAISAVAGVVGASDTVYYTDWASVIGGNANGKTIELRDGAASMPVALALVNNTVTIDGTYLNPGGTAFVDANVTFASGKVINNAGNPTRLYTAKYDGAQFVIGGLADLVYNGADQATDPTVAYGETSLVKGTDYTVAYSADTKNVGTVTVTVTGTGTDYDGENSATYDITQKGIVVTADAKTKVYGEVNPPLTYVVTGMAGGETQAQAATGAVATEAVQFSNVGDYGITRGTVAATSNYKIDSYVPANLKITPATITDVSVAQDGTLTYNGQAQAPAVTTAATTVNDQATTFTYSATEGAYGAMPTFTDKGTYTVFYQVTAPNHNSVTGSFEATIGKKALTIAVAGVAQSPFYSGLEKKVTLEAGNGFTLSCADALYNASDVVFTTREVTRTDVGETAYGLAAGEFSYDDDNFDVTFDVTDAKLTVLGNVPGERVIQLASDSVKVYIPAGTTVTVDASRNVTVPAGKYVIVKTTARAEATGSVAADGAITGTADYLYGSQADVDAIAALANPTLAEGVLNIRAQEDAVTWTVANSQVTE